MALNEPRRARVLCVDDLADSAEALRMIIDSDPKLTCVGCLGSADELVAELRGGSCLPDVVVLDATMPGKDPLQATKEVATECPGTRIIVYSGHDDPHVVDRFLGAGAWGYVSKAADPVSLLEAVHSVIAGGVVYPSRGRSR